MKNKVIEILKSENDGIEDLATRIDLLYSGEHDDKKTGIMKNKVIEKQIDEMFKGIDKNDCDDNDGWWKTSTGAEFGKGKIEELKQFIDSLYSGEVSEPPEGWCQCKNEDVTLLEAITVCRHCNKQINPNFTPQSAKSAHATEGEIFDANSENGYMSFAGFKAALANGSQSNLSEEELDKMAEEYSKEILPNEKDGSQSRCGLEVGYIDGYKAARGVRPVSDDKINVVVSEVEDIHPYKQAGNADSYSEYAEGWTDACDILGERIKAAIKQLNKKP